MAAHRRFVLPARVCEAGKLLKNQLIRKYYWLVVADGEESGCQKSANCCPHKEIRRDQPSQNFLTCTPE